MATLNPSDRVAAVEALGWSRPPDALPQLLSYLADPDRTVQRVAVVALGRLADPAAIGPLLAALSDSDALLRSAVIDALAQIASPRAAPALLEALHDPDPAVRRGAARALGRIGEPQTADGLAAALHDPDAYVCQAARRAILRIEELRGMPGLLASFENGPPETALPGRPQAPPAGGRGSSAGGHSVSHRRHHAHHRKHRSTCRREFLPWLQTGHIVGAVAMFALASLLALLAWFWFRPLGPRLPALAASVDGASPQAAALPAAAPDPMCGGPPVEYVMLVGIDAENGDYTSNSAFADVIRIARVDYSYGRLSLLAIPRDLWVSIPGMEQYGIKANRIKTAYTYGYHYQVPGGGPALLTQTLSEHFGVRVDHYVVANFAVFENGIDALGGIDMVLDEPLGTPGGPDPYFPAGPQHLDGASALAYSRLRPDNSSDLYRIDRQTQLLVALRDRLVSPDMLSRLPAVIGATRRAVVTDLSPSDINRLLCFARQVSPEAITAVDLDPSTFSSAIDAFGYERLIPDEPAVAAFVSAFNAGNIPAASAP